MKQTAIEWLIEEIILRLGIRIENTFDGNNLLKQAKEMEKEQIIEAHGSKQYHKSISGEQYYNETFKNITK